MRLTTAVIKPELARRKGLSTANTQNKLNSLYRASQMPIANSYAEVLLVFSVTLMYGSSLPILYGMAAIGFWLKFEVDRRLLLRTYVRPSLTDARMLSSFHVITHLFVMVHASFGVYFHSMAGGEHPYKAVFAKDSDQIQFDPFLPHVRPMLLGLAMSVLYPLTTFGMKIWNRRVASNARYLKAKYMRLRARRLQDLQRQRLRLHQVPGIPESPQRQLRSHMPRWLCHRTGHQPKVPVRPVLHPGAAQRSQVPCRREPLPSLRWLRRLSISGHRSRMHQVQRQPDQMKATKCGQP